MAATAGVSKVKIKVLSISILDPASGEEVLNNFLASHQVMSLDKEFVRFEQGAYWSFVIGYLGEHQGGTAKRSSVDSTSSQAPSLGTHLRSSSFEHGNGEINA